MNTQTQSVTFSPTLDSLGICLRVSYVGATNSRPSKWKAEIKDSRAPHGNVKAFAYYGYTDSEADKKLAIQYCLTKWAATFGDETRPKAFHIHSKGFEDNADLYFFTVTR